MKTKHTLLKSMEQVLENKSICHVGLTSNWTLPDIELTEQLHFDQKVFH